MHLTPVGSCTSNESVHGRLAGIWVGMLTSRWPTLVFAKHEKRSAGVAPGHPESKHIADGMQIEGVQSVVYGQLSEHVGLLHSVFVATQPSAAVQYAKSSQSIGTATSSQSRSSLRTT